MVQLLGIKGVKKENKRFSETKTSGKRKSINVYNVKEVRHEEMGATGLGSCLMAGVCGVIC